MIQLKILRKKMRVFGISISDKVSRFVGTWTFVGLYTASMLLWIGLHWGGYLHIDSADFIKWNLWLSYFAGTQASIVLMSSNRQASKDREEQRDALQFDIKTLGLAEDNNKKIQHLTRQLKLLESVIEDFVEEEHGKK